MSPHPALPAWEPLRRMDVTPLVNVVFVLLVIAFVTTPAMTGGSHVLPAARNAEVVDSARVTVTLLDDARFWLAYGDRGLVVAARDIPARLHEVFDGEPAGERVLYLRADRGAAYRHVLVVVRGAREAGVRRVGLLVNRPRDRRR